MPPERRSSGFGARLRDARERRGVSLRDIAGATKISVAVLEALERDDISKLPGGIFGRAFVRSYAVEVGLDPETTIQDFITQFPNDSVTAGHPTSDRGEDSVAFEGERRTAATFLWLIAISVPIVAGVLYFATLGRRSAMQPSRPQAIAGGTDAPSPPESLAQPPPAVSEPATQPPPTATAATQSAGPDIAASAPTSGASDAPLPATTSAADLLAVALTVKRPCWVSVTVDGQKSIERLLQPGERPALTVHRDIVLTAGDASAIAVAFNGAEARPLGKAGEVVTARFTLANYKEFLQTR
jgi:cytoskeleton protein RodZ